MQLSRLKSAILKKITKTKQANGSYIEEYQTIRNCKVILQELTDEVSASIYGANLNKTYRISSPRKALELLLQAKVNNTSDNISKYVFFIADRQYKIVSVKENWIDIEWIA